MENTFTAKEQQVRNKWLYVTKWLCFGIPAISAIGVAAQYFLNLCGVDAFFVVAGSLVLNIISFYSLKHCSYKKQGTILLTISMYLLPIGMVVELLQSTIVSLPFALANTAIGIWWIVQSKKLKVINKELNAVEDAKIYFQGSLNQIKAVNDVQELETLYAQLLQKWPNSKDSIQSAYEEKKALLTAVK